MSLLETSRMWFWASEVATICNVSKYTVYRWIESGKLIPLLKVPPVKIPRDQVERLLNLEVYPRK